MRHYGLIGAGGFGREVMPLLQAQVSHQVLAGEADVSFVVDAVDGQRVVNGVPVVSVADFLGLPGERYFNIAIGDSQVRERFAAACADGGASPFSIVAGNAGNLACNAIGDGAIFCPFSMVTSNARIGRFFHANIYSYVAHDCEVGDFVTFAPGVCCNGNVRIENHAYVGTGAVLRQGARGRPLVVGRGAVVGMGAVVTKDVPPGTTVIGNPARPMERK